MAVWLYDQGLGGCLELCWDRYYLKDTDSHVIGFACVQTLKHSSLILHHQTESQVLSSFKPLIIVRICYQC